MSPNGRRAWRKWCKRARLRMNQHHRALYRGATMRKKQPERALLQPKPFTARSLVGMTMGARKRAAWHEHYYLVGGWPFFRAKYRVGQKLRPCPGCRACRKDPTYQQQVSGWDALSSSLCVSAIKANCDGSGAMPARKAKRALIASLPKEKTCP